jgi:hypothetical protein
VLLRCRRLIGVLFDSEQLVAFFDLLPFGEIPPLDEPRGPRDDINLVNCSHPADEIARLRHLTANRRVTETDGGGEALWAVASPPRATTPSMAMASFQLNALL